MKNVKLQIQSGINIFSYKRIPMEALIDNWTKWDYMITCNKHKYTQPQIHTPIPTPPSPHPHPHIPIPTSHSLYNEMETMPNYSGTYNYTIRVDMACSFDHYFKNKKNAC